MVICMYVCMYDPIGGWDKHSKAPYLYPRIIPGTIAHKSTDDTLFTCMDQDPKNPYPFRWHMPF